MGIPDLIRQRPLPFLLAAALLYYLSYFNFGIDLDDEGFLLVNAQAILHGQWPMADFFSYQPLGYFLLALFFRIFGDGLLVERSMLMSLLLVNIGLIYYCARRLMPPGWATLPAVIYAIAPGPWYKVHFISVLLYALAATLFYQDKPRFGRAVLIGICAGIALMTRAQAGLIALAAEAALVPFTLWWLNRGAEVSHLTRRSLVHLAGVLGGAAAIVGCVVLAYWSAGKLDALVQNTRHYYVLKDVSSFVVQNLGRQSIFDPVSLFVRPTLEMWSWAVGLAICSANLWRVLAIAKSCQVSKVPISSLASIALFGLGSMAYTFFFVWNSRMLSSFGIVYVNFFFLAWITGKVLPNDQRGFLRRNWLRGAAGFAIVLYLVSFKNADFYSGSISARQHDYVAVDHSLLHGIRVDPPQAETILQLMAMTRTAAPQDCLIPMSEATTTSYLAGLCNPTYYRLFTAEFAPTGEIERAITQFEHYRIRYFVARRQQFLPGGGPGSNLDAYAPEIKAYLQENYTVTPLGAGFVMLERNSP